MSKSQLNNKNSQEDYTKASRFGNITRSPAELWKSGNPWQCDFCFSLCIKSRCQEPSPPQPGAEAGSTLHLLALLCPPRPLQHPPGLQMSPSMAAVEHLWPESERKKRDVGYITRQRVQRKPLRYTLADLSGYRGLKDDSTPLCNKNRHICGMWRMTPQSSLLHRPAGCSRWGVSSEHAEPATWSVLF